LNGESERKTHFPNIPRERAAIHPILGNIFQALRRFPEQRDRAGDGQADYIEVAAFYAWNPTGGVALNRVGSGFVERLAAADILRDLSVLEEVERDLRDLHVGEDLASVGNGNACEDGVRAPAEKLQHTTGILNAGGLAQDVAIAYDTGVGAENKERILPRVERAAKIPDGLCLFFGEALNVSGGALVPQTFFVDIGGLYLEGKASLCEQFAATR
jgi:hypothetical protein